MGIQLCSGSCVEHVGYVLLSRKSISLIKSSLGNMQLAEVEDTVVIAFTDEGGDDNARLMSQLNCAYRVRTPTFLHFHSVSHSW